MTDDERLAILDAIRTLEKEAYMHGVRNAAPGARRSSKTLMPLPERGIRDPVGGPHHEARRRVESLLGYSEGTL